MAGAPTKQGGVGYGDSAPRGDDEATAFAAMLVRMTMWARRTGDEEAAAVALRMTPRRMAGSRRAMAVSCLDGALRSRVMFG